MIFFVIITFFSLLILIISIYNFFTLPALNSNGNKKGESLSICLPMRNEENNIKPLLDGLISQDHQNYEILIYDDNSTDKTFALAQKISEQSKKIKIIQGGKLPAGWQGKQHACWQLAQQAQNEILLFIDADVRVKPNFLSSIIKNMGEMGVKALSCLPAQKNTSWATELSVPIIMQWMIFGHLPLKYFLQKNMPGSNVACGQFLMMEKKYYFEIGGHEAIKNNIVDDMAMARLVNENGEKMPLLFDPIGKYVHANMYQNLNSSLRGFQKNFFALNNESPLNTLLWIINFLFIQTMPYLLVWFYPLFIWPLVINLISKLIFQIKFRHNPAIQIVLHPLQMILSAYIAFTSAFSRQYRWKDRVYEKK